MNHMHINYYGSYMLNITRKRILNMKQKFTSIFLRFYSFKYDILNMFWKTWSQLRSEAPSIISFTY
jgi:hypothetical protein